MTRRVALATYEHAPGLAADDRLLPPALAAHGIESHAVVWSDPAVDWRAFDAVIVRSCWDYHLRHAEFLGWLDRLGACGIRVMNPPSLMRWNSDKRYLLDLARRGIATIPTMVVERDRPRDVVVVAAAEGWSRIVIKPAVSASGYETYALEMPPGDAASASIERATSVGDILVQPFAPEVPRDGEFSFVFIDGVFSHAAIKRARGGEFRVQTEHGGTVDGIEADERLVAQAAHVIGVLPEVPLYARVDGIARGDAFLLMELELIEPNLFMELEPESPGRLAAAIARRLG